MEINYLTQITTPIYISNNSINNPNVNELPGGKLKTGDKILVVESGTIEFTNAVKSDIPGAKVNIKTTTKDKIAIRTKSIKTFEITPDIKGDETILIDIDDTSRF